MGRFGEFRTVVTGGCEKRGRPARAADVGGLSERCLLRGSAARVCALLIARASPAPCVCVCACVCACVCVV